MANNWNTKSTGGPCSSCNRPIAAGSDANYHIGLGMRHLECVGAPLAPVKPEVRKAIRVRKPNALGPVSHPWAHDEED